MQTIFTNRPFCKYCEDSRGDLRPTHCLLLHAFSPCRKPVVFVRRLVIHSDAELRGTYVLASDCEGKPYRETQTFGMYLILVSVQL
jgi:hypothetical protein